MIHTATIEITCDTSKSGTEDWVKFTIKADPKVPNIGENFTLKNYPAIHIAGLMLELLQEKIDLTKVMEQQELNLGE